MGRLVATCTGSRKTIPVLAIFLHIKSVSPKLRKQKVSLRYRTRKVLDTEAPQMAVRWSGWRLRVDALLEGQGCLP